MTYVTLPATGAKILVRDTGGGIYMPLSEIAQGGAALAQDNGLPFRLTDGTNFYTAGTETTAASILAAQVAAQASLTTIVGARDVAASTRASEATLEALRVLVANGVAVSFATPQHVIVDAATLGTVSVDGSAHTQPISATALPLPALAATSTLQSTGNASLASIVTALGLLATDAVAQAIRDRLPGSFGGGGGVKIDGSGTALPVSGTVAATNANLDVALSTLGSQVTSAAILAKLSSDPATQTTLAAVLAKLTSDPSTATLQGTGNTSLAAILAKIVAAPALDASITGSGAMSGWDVLVVTTVAVAGSVVKAGAGTFGSVTATNSGGGAAAFLQVHNAASASGLSASTLIAVTAVTVGNSSSSTLNAVAGGKRATAGIVVVFSLAQFSYSAVSGSTGGAIVDYR